ncbi:Aste57867_172 [Aphanomyces stellatus]|uniref:Exocyst subunit Exo70 family protein n=1 Tax=Aphanomyces stellatus TaxID=120398 RepID=A0A485K6W7_9STRA|nr:hypothetical protein As57867_000172 [Aphanomyces stellatus]VFT77398.1 Aste57867_172 [Aphanomyces stellatus]
MEVQASNEQSIALIRSALSDSKMQLASVNSVLVGFKAGLDRLEGQMMPIYNLTEKLRETQKNIDFSVHELRAVDETFNTATEVRMICTSKMHKIAEVATTLLQGAKYDQVEYIQSMQKLLKSISFLEAHRGYEGSGKALEQARQLLVQAQVKCKSDIVNDVGFFARYSHGNNSSENSKIAHVVVLQPSDSDLSKVAELVQCLLGTGFPPRQLLIEYGEKRLKIIKDYFRDSKLSSEYASNKSPLLIERRDANDSKERISQHLDDIVDVIRAEKNLSSRIFPNEDLNHAALSYTIAPLLESLTNDVNDESHPKDDVFHPLDLHYLFKDKSAAFKDALQPPLRLREHPGVETTEPWKLANIIGKIEEGLAVTSKQKLNKFKDDISESLLQDKHGLKDGNVHPISSNVMKFLRHLCDHVVELECLLAIDQTSNVSYYLDSIVMKLIESLQTKASHVKGREDLRALFVVNNIFYISNSLKLLGNELHSQAPGATAALQQTIQPKISSLGDKSIQYFIQTSYDVFDPILSDPKSTLQYTRNSDVLTLDSGRLLKDKFSKFNATLEEIHLNHKAFMVPDGELRQKLLSAAVQRVVPVYTSFYDKYSKIHFSKKNMEKYVKYNPPNVDAMLREMFTGGGPKTPPGRAT